MQWIRALAPALVAGCAAVVSLSVVAQAPPAGARAPVDVRAMVPGPQASDAAAEPSPAASGLTRNQRKEAALQARQEGALQPAGEGEPRGDKAAAPASAPRAGSAMASIPPAPAPAVAADASPPTIVAAVPPPAKKSTRKKARAASAPPA